MINLIWRTDVHLADVGPATRKDVWSESLLSKIRQIGLIAGKVGADVVLDGGDLFHFKSPSKTSHNLVREIIEVHKTYPCPVYGCVGNHDVRYGDLVNLPGQPLEILFSTGVLGRLYDEHELLLDDGETKVRVVGVPYHGVKYDLDRFRVEKKDEDILILVGHALASERGGSMFEGEDILSYNFLREIDADITCFGHWHKDQGVQEISPGKWVVNIGSVSRGSLSQDNLIRKPSIAWIQVKEKVVRIKKIPLKVLPAEEIFLIEQKKEVSDQKEKIEVFLDALKLPLAAHKTTLFDRVRDLDVSSDLKERLHLYLEQTQNLKK